MEVILWILGGYFVATISIIIFIILEEKEAKIMEEKFRKEEIERLKMKRISESLDKIKKGMK